MDDDETLRDAVGEMLAALGYSVIRAQDSDEAIHRYQRALAEGKDIQLVLLDLTIPGGRDGMQTAEELRKTGSKARFVAMSGYSAEGTPQLLNGGGFVGRLAKPFRLEELAALLQTVFPGSAGGV